MAFLFFFRIIVALFIIKLEEVFDGKIRFGF